MYDLAVAYRIYPGVSKSPACFPTDKFKLSELCLRSFCGALGRLNAKVWLLLDGCPPEYEALFRDLLSDHTLEVMNLNRVGNAGTFSLQMNILTKQKEARLVYLAEDDYFYLPGSIEKMVNFMNNHLIADFVTPYDHPDNYDTPSQHEEALIRPWDDRHWRTVSSTCLTFLTSRETLRKTAFVLRTYCAGNMDCSMWLALTEKARLLNPRIHWMSIVRLKIWVRTWFWGWRGILLGPRYHLWAPIPALATHMESTRLAPLIDWQDEFLRAQQDIDRNI